MEAVGLSPALWYSGGPQRAAPRLGRQMTTLRMRTEGSFYPPPSPLQE